MEIEGFNEYPSEVHQYCVMEHAGEYTTVPVLRGRRGHRLTFIESSIIRYVVQQYIYLHMLIYVYIATITHIIHIHTYIYIYIFIYIYIYIYIYIWIEQYIHV